jgi:hypothetical protein
MEWIQPTSLKGDAPRQAIEEALDRDVSRPLEQVPWNDFPLAIKTTWSLLHGEDAFFVSFRSEEVSIRATETGPEARVCEDSCVEWFLDWGKGVYFNIEINPIGSCAFERGQERHGRENLLLSEVSGYRCWADQGETPFQEKPATGPWNAWAVLPYHLLPITREELIRDGLRANFYKCGDSLKTPHYNTWAPIDTPQPDFHRPEKFAPLSFKAP